MCSLPPSLSPVTCLEEADHALAAVNAALCSQHGCNLYFFFPLAGKRAEPGSRAGSVLLPCFSLGFPSLKQASTPACLRDGECPSLRLNNRSNVGWSWGAVSRHGGSCSPQAWTGTEPATGDCREQRVRGRALSKIHVLP